MTKIFHLSCFLFYILSFSFSFAQDLSYTIYDQSRGLAHNHVYSIIQDKNGFIWINTEAGVSRFDGLNFVNYFVSDGLTDNEILEVHEGGDGKIWFMSYTPGISYYKNGKIYNNENDSVLSQVSFNAFVKQMCNATNGNIYMLTEKNEIYLLSEKELKLINANVPAGTITYLWKDLKGEIWVVASDYYFNTANDKTVRSKYRVPMRKSAATVLKNRVLVKESEKGIALFDGHAEKIIIPFDSINSEINYIYADRYDNLWLMLRHGVVYFEKNENGWGKKGTFLKYYVILRIVQDNEGGMWFGTTDKGVLYSPSQKILSYFQKTALSSGGAYCITGDKVGNTWFGLGENKIGIIGNGIQKIIPLNTNVSASSSGRVLDILSRNDGSIWAGGDNGVFRIANLKSEIGIPVYISSCKKIIDNGNSVIIGFSEGVIELEGNEIRKIFNQRTHALAVLNDTVKAGHGLYLLIGTNQGMKLFNGTEILPYLANNPVNNRITDIKIAGDGSIWFSTYGYGVGMIKDGNVIEIRQINGLTSNICKSLFIDENNNVWIATNNGISRIKSENTNPPDVISYTTRDGLPSNDVNAVHVRSDTVWVASAAGVSFFNYTIPLRQKTAPSVYIKRITLNQNDTDLVENAILPHDFNNITFYFTGISYQSFGHTTYKYRLTGVEHEWNVTATPLVRYSSLPAGEYLFELYAVSADGVQSEKPAKFSFAIRPHFLFSKPVIIAEIIILVLLLVLLVQFVSYTAKAKEKRKTELAVQFAESEMKALRAQMNPHFIFNSINTLHGYIIDSDKKAAYEYLEKFGSLMRNILEQSAEKRIALQDEIDTLRIYLILEASRFEKKFDYSISVSGNINTKKIFIPPMLLQPYIENSIKHGIIPKKDKGEIEISFKTKGNTLICSLKDNGIGRKKSLEIKSGHERKSFGMDITKQRIDLLNKIYSDGSYKILIHDLYDSMGVAGGTLVEIFIPINYLDSENKILDKWQIIKRS